MKKLYVINWPLLDSGHKTVIVDTQVLKGLNLEFDIKPKQLQARRATTNDIKRYKKVETIDELEKI